MFKNFNKKTATVACSLAATVLLLGVGSAAVAATPTTASKPSVVSSAPTAVKATAPAAPSKTTAPTATATPKTATPTTTTAPAPAKSNTSDAVSVTVKSTTTAAPQMKTATPQVTPTTTTAPAPVQAPAAPAPAPAPAPQVAAPTVQAPAAAPQAEAPTAPAPTQQALIGGSTSMARNADGTFTCTWNGVVLSTLAGSPANCSAMFSAAEDNINNPIWKAQPGLGSSISLGRNADGTFTVKYNGFVIADTAATVPVGYNTIKVLDAIRNASNKGQDYTAVAGYVAP